MANIKIETKNSFEIEKKPRVYFTCHADDFEKYFKKVCEDIFKTHDCVIYYKEDMNEEIAESEKEVDLGRNNLFVVPVTFKLLTTSNCAMDEDIAYALKEHIPVLPIMMESGVDMIYSRPDKFGEIQYLNPFSTDLTEVSYEEKLRKYLDSVLISGDLANRIRDAFDAYIFLSYRKKDRKYANQLIKLIHASPECRDIAIWFDEFLVPGESFKETIEKMLDDCKLFTLLVTPQLLEKVVDEDGVERDNYVISTELPLAQKKKEEKGTDIFAVEMESTDKEKLAKVNVCDSVYFEDENFKKRLLEAVEKIAISENNTPEHNFLIGLAYLEGIDVEVNRKRAIELITEAADAGLLEAMKKISEMHENGIGTTVDYKKTTYWAEKIADYYVKEYGEENDDALDALNTLVMAYHSLGEYEKALELNEKVYELRCKVSGENNVETLPALSNLGASYGLLGDYEKSFELDEKVYNISKNELGEEHPDTLSYLSNLASSYSNLGKYEKALELNVKAYELRCRLLGEKHYDTIISLNNLAMVYSDAGDYEKALELNEKAYSLRCEILEENHPDTLQSIDNIAHIYGEMGEYQKALELNEKAYNLKCEILGEEHPNTLITLSNLATRYNDIRKYKKMLELCEKVYSLRLKILGEEHPDTLQSLSNLAMAYGELKEYEKSWEMKKTAYNLMHKVLGEKHPDTLIALNNLAVAYGCLGSYEEELKLEQEVYKLRCEMLGEEHPDTLTTLNNIANTCNEMGEYQKALDFGKKLRELNLKVLGEEHPNTLVSLQNLASYFLNCGDTKQAFSLLKDVYGKQCTLYGENDKRNISVLRYLIFVTNFIGNRTAEIIYKNKLKKIK